MALRKRRASQRAKTERDRGNPESFADSGAILVPSIELSKADWSPMFHEELDRTLHLAANRWISRHP
jgi:hypothetical protein